jgi:hypothetical protein
MEPAKYFNNVIIGQFVLTGVPVKVYIGGRYLTITDADDVEDPIFGFGMDEDGDMQRFDYRNVMQLSVSGNVVDLETYNKGMEDKFSGGEEKSEEPKDDAKAEPVLKQVHKKSTRCWELDFTLDDNKVETNSLKIEKPDDNVLGTSNDDEEIPF